MEPRLIAAHPRVEYFLDCSSDNGELDVCSCFTLRLYGNDAEILKVIDEKDNDGFRARRRKCLALAEIADAILARLPVRRRSGLIRSGMHYLIHELEQHAECLANWAIEDEIDGGCMLNFRARPRRRREATFKRTDRRVRSAKFIRRYVKKEGPQTCEHLITLTRIMLRRARRWGTAYDPGIFRDYRAQLNHKIEMAARKDRRKAREERKMIRRSLATALAVVGPETVSAFLRGEEVRLIGQQAMLTVRKRGRLADRGHGCLSIGMADRDGTRLADLCTFIEGTPTLDQLTGFALWMGAGEEEAVLRQANVVQLEPAGRSHPMLIKRAADQRHAAVEELARLVGPETAAQLLNPPAGSVRRRDPMDCDARRERNRRYYEETNGEWMEALLVLVIGYRNLPVFKEAEAL